MKPYTKTFRCSKKHKASECSLCAERIAESKKATRVEAKKQINNDFLDMPTFLRREI